MLNRAPTTTYADRGTLREAAKPVSRATSRYLEHLSYFGRPPYKPGSVGAHCRRSEWSEFVWQSRAGEEIGGIAMRRRQEAQLAQGISLAFTLHGWQIVGERITTAGLLLLSTAETSSANPSPAQSRAPGLSLASGSSRPVTAHRPSRNIAKQMEPAQT